MAIAAARSINCRFTGDFVANNTYLAASNSDSPGTTEIKTLALGDNTITPPSGGTTPKGCTIIPPSGNVTAITLKGVNGDTGVGLHLTDPTSIGLASPTATFVLNVGAEIEGVTLVWT